MKLLALRKRVAEATEKSKSDQKRKKKRRAECKEKRRDEFFLDPNAYQDREPERKKLPNSSDVWQWFYERLKKKCGDNYVVQAWTTPQKTLAKKLLNVYGEELVKKAVDYLFNVWDDMVQDSRGRLSGEPTVNFLWGARERVLADVQSGRKPERRRRREHGEYIGKTNTPGIGW